MSEYIKGLKKSYAHETKNSRKKNESINSYLLRLLLNATPYYISGNSIANSLKMSRVAVWARITKLRDEGFTIEASQNKGYRLAIEPNKVNKSLIEAWLTKKNVVCKLYVYDSLDSTNSEAERLLTNEETIPFAILANKQHSGRGRLGKDWYSPSKGNLYLSIAFKPNLDALRLRKFTLWQGISICNYLRTLCKTEDIKLKWPNDIIVGNKKLGGMLTEAKIDCENIKSLVFGFGLNINSKVTSYSNPFNKIATSIYELIGKKTRVNEISASIIKIILQSYNQCITGINDHLFIEEWNKLDSQFNKKISINIGNNQYTGIANGIDNEGGLKIKLGNGHLKIFHSGEISTV